MYRFTIQAVDVRGRVGSHSVTMSVAPRLRLGTRSLPSATVGHVYRSKLAVVGGTTRRIWTISRGRLPRGIHLDRVTGIVSGKPVRAGTYRLSVSVIDELKVSGSRTLTMVVRPRPERATTSAP